MNKRHTSWKLAGVSLTVMCLPLIANAETARTARPNIIFILADDLGAEALGCYGGKNYKGLGSVRTPNLDALARDGMRFQQFFSTPNCSPTRAQFLTGQYNFRTGFTDILGRNGATTSLDTKAHPTVAVLLKEAGYATAVVGKWHVGPPEGMAEIPRSAEEDTAYPHPRDGGFDRQCLIAGAHLRLYGKPEPESAYTPALLQDWALRFIESREGKPEPFFLYYASPIPHVPLFPTPLNAEDAKGQAGGYGSAQKGDNKNFPFLIEYLDRQVGEILAKLDETGLRDSTLVLFAGDNGTHRSISTEMADGRVVRGGKGTMLDTGSWVPLLANWPGVVPAGSVYEGLVDFTDLFPTFLDLAGVPVPEGIDGISFAPQLQGLPGTPRAWVHSLKHDEYFVRDARWKLREDGALYDVSDSPHSETLADAATDEAKAARARLQAVTEHLHPSEPVGKQ